MKDYITVSEFLEQTFKRWWEIQKELGRIKLARVEKDGKVREQQCFFGSFSLRERQSFGELIPLDANKASFIEPVEKDEKIELDGKRFKVIPIAEVPWGDIKEYVVALVEYEGGEK